MLLLSEFSLSISCSEIYPFSALLLQLGDWGHGLEGKEGRGRGEAFAPNAPWWIRPWKCLCKGCLDKECQAATMIKVLAN